MCLSLSIRSFIDPVLLNPSFFLSIFRVLFLVSISMSNPSVVGDFSTNFSNLVRTNGSFFQILTLFFFSVLGLLLVVNTRLSSPYWLFLCSTSSVSLCSSWIPLTTVPYSFLPKFLSSPGLSGYGVCPVPIIRQFFCGTILGTNPFFAFCLTKWRHQRIVGIRSRDSPS